MTKFVRKWPNEKLKVQDCANFPNKSHHLITKHVILFQIHFQQLTNWLQF